MTPLARCQSALGIALEAALDARDNGDSIGSFAETLIAYITAAIGAAHTAEANSEVMQ